MDKLRQLIHWHVSTSGGCGDLTHKQAVKGLDAIRAATLRQLFTMERHSKATLRYLASYETLSLPHEKLEPLIRQTMFGPDRAYRPGPDHAGIAALLAAREASRALIERVDYVLSQMRANGELRVEAEARKSAAEDSAFLLLVEMIVHFWVTVLERSPEEERRGRQQVSTGLIAFAMQIYRLTSFVGKIGEVKTHLVRALQCGEWRKVLYGPYTFGDHP